jgi:GNAT superfamily N-acetyltransferase
VDDLSIRRESLDSATARMLIGELNAELLQTYWEDKTACHFRLDLEEVAEGRGAFLIADAGGSPIGCGAVRRLDERTAELKRMYVVPSHRGRGVGRALLNALEAEARRIGVSRLLLETGVRQAAAMALYTRAGYTSVAPYGEYMDSPLSVCMGKDLAQ